MSVFYKFKAWKEAATIPVDSTGISVWDLKSQIITANNLANSAKDFDLQLFNSQSGEEFRNDHTIVPRSTTVTARRVPAKRPSRGSAQNYVVADATPSVSAPNLPTHQHQQPKAEYKGRAMSMRFDVPNPAVPGLSENPAAADDAIPAGNQDEAARLEAMFEQSDQQWEQTQNEMAMRKRVPFRPGVAGARAPGQRMHPSMDKPPPQGYTCFRCGISGHWIQDCPTNSDPNFENRPKAKRTTGIPKSFLQTVEEPAEGQSGLMVTADGGFVIARPDAASWAEHRSAVPKNLSADDVQALQPEDPDLQCSIDSRLLKQAVKVPCCSTSFCEECITKYLQAHSFVCPECESKVKTLAQLKPDEDRRERVSAYIEDLVQASRENKARAEEEEGVKAEDKEGQEGDKKDEGEASQEEKRASTGEGQQEPAREGSREPKAASPPPQDAAAQQVMMLQMQMQQVMMMLSNPMLPPPARMQLGMQLQQLQMMFVMSQQAQQQMQQQQQQQQKTPENAAGAEESRKGKRHAESEADSSNASKRPREA